MDEAPVTDFVESFWHIEIDGVNLAATSQEWTNVVKSLKQVGDARSSSTKTMLFRWNYLVQVVFDAIQHTTLKDLGRY